MVSAFGSQRFTFPAGGGMQTRKLPQGRIRMGTCYTCQIQNSSCIGIEQTYTIALIEKLESFVYLLLPCVIPWTISKEPPRVTLSARPHALTPSRSPPIRLSDQPLKSTSLSSNIQPNQPNQPSNPIKPP